jgi:hypothetical protein
MQKSNNLGKDNSGKGTKEILTHSSIDQIQKFHDIISVQLTPSMLNP